ncbi:MAG: amidohydrolase family protein [Myxococcota bacterium]|jgi:imidazolonepropionase-like amidohydrolase
MARIILKNANLLDGDSAAKPGMNVVVEGECIASIGAAPVQAKPEDRVIELAGKTLMPGIVSGHFHASYNNITIQPEPLGVERPENYLALVAAKNLKLALDCGITSVISSGANAGTIDADVWLAIQEGLIPGPRMMPASRGLDAVGGYTDTEKWWWNLGNKGAQLLCSGPAEFERAVRTEIKRGARMIKVFLSGGHAVPEYEGATSLSKEELATVIRTAHARHAKVRAHCAWKNVILEAVAAGIDVIDHGDQLDEECMDAMTERGVFWIPSAFFTAQMIAPGAALAMATPEQMAPLRNEFDNVLRRVQQARTNGMRVVLGDDYGIIVLPHGRYMEELEFYVKQVGIPALDVIRWSTKNGGELLGGAIKTGLLRAGYYADLLVVDGDPSADIALLQQRDKVRAILKGGAFVRDGL